MSQVMSALDTFMQRVRWSPLDVLVIDMPPGTGERDPPASAIHQRHAGLQYMARLGWQHMATCNEGAPCLVLLPSTPPCTCLAHPCGAGDAQLSISQRLSLSGAVIVSTPQARRRQSGRGAQRLSWFFAPVLASACRCVPSCNADPGAACHALPVACH